MKVLVVGSGGREHSLCWAVCHSPLCDELYCAPGNAGTDSVAVNVDIQAEDLDGLIDFIQDTGIDFVVVGPEAPLVSGLVDRLDVLGIKSFGPTAAAAEIEGSKAFTKDLCAKYDIPTADYDRFDEPDAAKEYIRTHGAPIVVKADGLAAGKGVIICRNLNEAFAAVDQIMIEEAFGQAGAEIVVEQFLDGEEASFFALVDGEHAVPLAGAQDHKRAQDGDEGPNTGGMGAYSPAPVVDEAMTQRIMDEIIHPTIRAMTVEGRPYKGVLYAGLMIDAEGPKLIEYNARFGDPECQVLMMRLKSDFLAALLACAEGRLDEIEIEWRDEAALVVVMAAAGYPGKYAKGSEIRRLEAADTMDDVVVFHAGTAAVDGKITAQGGRVLGVTALGADVAEAQVRAYAAVDVIDWPEGFCRRDIGRRAIDRCSRLRPRREGGVGRRAPRHRVRVSTRVDRASPRGGGCLYRPQVPAPGRVPDIALAPPTDGETKMDDKTRTEVEAAAFRGLVKHLQKRTDVQNIDLMNLAGFCRNCLSKWYAAEAQSRGEDVDYDAAREIVYGMPYGDWKDQHQAPATDDQKAKFEKSKPLHAEISGHN